MGKIWNFQHCDNLVPMVVNFETLNVRINDDPFFTVPLIEIASASFTAMRNDYQSGYLVINPMALYMNSFNYCLAVFRTCSRCVK